MFLKFYLQVSVQITHHVGSETEEQVNQNKLTESGIAVELADPQAVTNEEQDEHVTVEFEPDTQTVQIEQQDLVGK